MHHEWKSSKGINPFPSLTVQPQWVKTIKPAQAPSVCELAHVFTLGPFPRQHNAIPPLTARAPEQSVFVFEQICLYIYIYVSHNFFTVTPEVFSLAYFFLPSFGMFRDNIFKEEEEEEEEDVNSVFSDDERVKFMGEKICQMLKVRTESWKELIITEETQSLLTDYFETRVKFLFFTSAESDVITVSSEVSVASYKVLQNGSL